MSIFAGTSEVKSIKAGTTDVKAVYAGDIKVWPTVTYPATALVITPIEEDIHPSGRAYVNVLKMNDRWFIDYGLNLHDVAGANAAGKIQKFSVKQVPSSTTLDCTLVGMGGVQSYGSRVYAGGAGGEVVLRNGISGLKTGSQFEFSGAGYSSNPNGKGTAVSISGLSTADVNIKTGYGGDGFNASGGTLFKADGREVPGNATQGGGAGASEKPVAGSAGDIGVSIPVYGVVGMGGTKLSSSNTEPQYIQSGKGRDAYQQDGQTNYKGGIGGGLIEVKGVSEIIIEGRDYIEVPDIPQIPTLPNHTFRNRVIYQYGQAGPDVGGGQYQTETGPYIANCNPREHDFHLMIGGCVGGAQVYEGVWETGYEGIRHQATSTGYVFTPIQAKAFASVGVAPRDITDSNHYVQMKVTDAYFAVDFLAYAWVIPHEGLGDPDESTLMWKKTSSQQGNAEVVVNGGIPYGAGIMCAVTYQTGEGASYSGLLSSQSGSSKDKRYSVAGGYKYFNFDARGEYIDPAPSTPGEITLRTFVFRRPNP